MRVEIWVALIGLGGLLISALAGLGGTLLGSFLSQRTAKATALELFEIERVKAAQDKMWDHRRAAYSDIIAKLHLLVKASDELVEGFTDGEVPPEQFFASAYYDVCKKEATDAFKATRQSFDDARLVLSDLFSERYVEFRTAIYATDEDDDPPTSAFAVLKAATDAHADLLAIARAEVAPQLPQAD
ncbi:hypothetical protein [Brevundimonas sp.]|uniref:hypothetical protein n=1 Tax=Brevundimonas sp. TaxID=1871086 RepID=UPI003A8D0740